MAGSKLVTQYHWADPSNYTAGRQDSIEGVAIHHTAGDSLSGAWGWWQNPNSNASAHYVIKGSEIVQAVDENYTAWSVGDWGGNSCTISIELVNSSTGGDWPVSQETLDTAKKLVAEIAKRYGWGKIKFEPDGVYPRLSAHRNWSATYCPGDYVYCRMTEIEQGANAINYPDKKAELVWSTLDRIRHYETNRDTHLYDFNQISINDLKQIESFAKGSKIDIYGKCENKTIGKTFLMTQYSYTNGKTNGFKDDALTEIAEAPQTPSDEPKPSEPTNEPSEPEKPQDEPGVRPDGTGDPNCPRGLSDEEYAKVLEEMKAKGQLIVENAKKEGAMIPMSNKVYDILKIIAIVVLPLISATYVALSKIWGFGFGTEIDQTIQIIIAAINVILGAALVKSSSDYKKNN